MSADVLGYPGRGVSINFTSTPPATPALPPPSPPPAPAPRSSSAAPVVATASSAADFRSALANSSVSAVVLTAHIYLSGGELVLAGAGRDVLVSSDPARCQQATAAFAGRSWAPPPPGQCVIDSGGLSRAFSVGAAARLRLEGVVLANGRSGLPGGLALASPGAQIQATRVTFADSSSLSDGGAIAAGNGAAVHLTNCAFLQAWLENPCISLRCR